jgi:hypothetical protein
VERDKPKQSESVGQTLPQLPWKQKRGDLKNVPLDVDVVPIKFHQFLFVPSMFHEV